MSNAADGYLGDWLPHKDNCRCDDCSLDRLRRKNVVLTAENKRLREALEVIRTELGTDRRYEGYFPMRKFMLYLVAVIDDALRGEGNSD